jgi:hypothetical protein
MENKKIELLYFDREEVKEDRSYYYSYTVYFKVEGTQQTPVNLCSYIPLTREQVITNTQKEIS